MVRALLNRALREAHPGERVTRVEISLGELASHSPTALQFYFAGLAHGTPAEGAALDVFTCEALLQCLTCDSILPLTASATTYPNCGSPVAVPDLRELRLEAIELHAPQAGISRRIMPGIVVREEPHP